ncbi:hypothetical protein [Methylobacterium sp. Leaf399]|uniref:hypothetical protein n=1 Tax=Methylobacterium sp. Leaf399 TaxID=1736364 RepID=UPI000B084F63|nr:hypothetical protein [Methylobacterium sp. Leaf399]
MRAKRADLAMVLAILLATVGILAASTASAAPNCNEAPYGQTCMRCYGWQGMSGWAGQACYRASNPGVRFACSISRCGAARLESRDRDRFRAQRPFARPDGGARDRREIFDRWGNQKR